jgi:hypothetical protein
LLHPRIAEPARIIEVDMSVDDREIGQAEDPRSTPISVDLVSL